MHLSVASRYHFCLNFDSLTPQWSEQVWAPITVVSHEIPFALPDPHENYFAYGLHIFNEGIKNQLQELSALGFLSIPWVFRETAYAISFRSFDQTGDWVTLSNHLSADECHSCLSFWRILPWFSVNEILGCLHVLGLHRGFLSSSCGIFMQDSVCVKCVFCLLYGGSKTESEGFSRIAAEIKSKWQILLKVIANWQIR